VGASVFVLGFASPALIPWVLNSRLPAGLKAFLSGALAFGIPELAMVMAVAILGKAGYQYLKQKLGKLLSPLAPPDRVSPIRYRVGLFLFLLPLLLGWIWPYLQPHWISLQYVPICVFIAGDLTLLVSLYILGGEFWDKLRGLFTQKAIIHWQE
jgi:hypothetical protein